jgi:hypothetical protein
MDNNILVCMWELISHKQVHIDTQNILRYFSIGVMKFQCHHWVTFEKCSAEDEDMD